MATFFVQNVTAPVDSEFYAGIRIDSASIDAARDEFLELHPAQVGDLLAAVQADNIIFSEAEEQVIWNRVALADVELPDEGS